MGRFHRIGHRHSVGTASESRPEKRYPPTQPSRGCAAQMERPRNIRSDGLQGWPTRVPCYGNRDYARLLQMSRIKGREIKHSMLRRSLKLRSNSSALRNPNAMTNRCFFRASGRSPGTCVRVTRCPRKRKVRDGGSRRQRRGGSSRSLVERRSTDLSDLNKRRRDQPHPENAPPSRYRCGSWHRQARSELLRDLMRVRDRVRWREAEVERSRFAADACARG